jgi:Dockerin type I domain/FG-GAP-like repeat
VRNLSMNRIPRDAWIRSLFLLCVFSFAVMAQNTQTPSRPGTTNPAGNPSNLTLFRDEQIYSMGVPSATGAPWRAATMSFDKDLTPSSTVSPVPWSSDIPFEQINAQAAVGRIVHSDRDDVVIVQRSGTDNTKLDVRFSDGSGSTLVGNMQARSFGYADFFATSVGDLDQLYDSEGNYHDEVVVAWMEPNSTFNAPHCSSPGVVPHIAVLNYNGGVNPSVLAQTVNRDDSQYLAYCILDIYNQQENLGRPTVPGWAPQPADNIMATAIGDFDGDGHNELAVAYMRGTEGLVISVVIYRYQNDGTTASLTPVNNYEFSIPNNSMVATLSLAAGNFDGSGVDQLLVGAAGWRGTISNGEYQRGTFVSQPFAFLLTAGHAQGTITAATSSGPNNSTTDFTVNVGSGVYVPRTVTIAGATGNWAGINGTWPVLPTSTGFTLDIDSSAFGTFAKQKVTVTTAAPLTQADSISLEPIPGITTGGIEVDDMDVDGRIRVQVVPGLFHYDPNSGFDYRRRQIAMAWNSRAAAKYGELAQRGDTHLAMLQITSDDKIQVAYTGNNLIGAWTLFQTLSMSAGALRGDNDTNDPTWSLYFSGFGLEFDNNQAYPNRNVYRGLVSAIWKVSPVDGDATKLSPAFVCSDKATADTYSPNSFGAPEPVCPIWVDAETAVTLPTTSANSAGNLNFLRLPSVAADLKGNSLKLGAPVHFEISIPAKVDYLLEQPPMHAAYLDLGPNNGGPQVVTVSRYPSGFNTSMTDSQSTDYSTNTTNHLDWTVGAAVEATAQSKTKEGAEADVAGIKLGAVATQTVNVSAKVKYDYENVSKPYTSGYDSLTVGEGATTGEDDSLFVEAQILDLWRYRIYGQGTNTGDPNLPNMFYEIVLPGPSLKIPNSAGRGVDWYQPVHEVGNILSYPGRTEVCGSDDKSPADIGPITIPNLSISNQAIPLISCIQESYDGNAAALNLKLDNQSGSGGTTDFTHSLSADVDISATSTTKESEGAFSEQQKFGLDVDIHGGADWGQMVTTNNSTSDATGITLNFPGGDSRYAYPYYTIFYNTTAGGLKVAYGVGDLTSSGTGKFFWIANYAQAPDPALNLPNRFNAKYNGSGKVVIGWTPEPTILRKSMKGFVVRKPNLNPLTNDYPLLGSNPQDGDKVLLEARVYNYSISSTPASFTVQFSVIPYDSNLNNEVCPNIPTTGSGRVCPASARTVIGSGNTSPDGNGNGTFTLNARENTKAYLVWDTTKFGPQSAGFNEYRVYVDLVSNTDELYPPEPPCMAVPCEDNFTNENIVDPGQNNEGWSLISVAKRQLGGPLGGSSSAASPTHGTLGTASTNRGSATPVALTAAKDATARAPKRPKPLLAYLLQPLPLRVTVFSSELSHLHGHVFIFDGKPGDPKSTTIAIKSLHGVTPEGTSSWFAWTPKTKGLHHLYAVIQNTQGLTPLGDIVVHVRRAPGDLNEDGRVDSHDLNMLQRDLKKDVAASACGAECDLDADGVITQKDGDLMSQLCDSGDCAFAHAEYVGGVSPEEPDMRTTRQMDDTARANFLAAHAEDNEVVSNADPVVPAQLYRTELQRKQSLRDIQYWYKGKPVTSGPLARQTAATAKR